MLVLSHWCKNIGSSIGESCDKVVVSVAAARRVVSVEAIVEKENFFKRKEKQETD